MTCFPRPVTNMNCSIPASRASSTPYWMTGLSTTGSISFGIALVAGRKRVPMPATGNTALRIRIEGIAVLCHRREHPNSINGLQGWPAGTMAHGECHGPYLTVSRARALSVAGSVAYGGTADTDILETRSGHLVGTIDIP